MADKQVFCLRDEASKQAYKLLSGLIVPRPIGWIGTVREDGSFNLAPFSFFNLVATEPPTVIFSGGRHNDRPKDSVVLAERSGDFTVNIVTEDLAVAMNATSGPYAFDVDEFGIAGVTATAGALVRSPLVVESPANLECRVTQVVELGGGSSRVIFGEVLTIHVRPDLLDGTRVDNSALRAIGRMAGRTYARTQDRFEMQRPAALLRGASDN